MARWAPRVPSFETRRAVPQWCTFQAWKEEAAISQLSASRDLRILEAAIFLPPYKRGDHWFHQPRGFCGAGLHRHADGRGYFGLPSFTLFGFRPSSLPSRVGPLPLLSGSPTWRPVRQVWPSTRWPSFRPTRRTSWRRWTKGPAWLLKPWRSPEATDLALRATKHTARAVGRSMAASVAAERHLWLNLTEIREREKVFLMDAPISQSGLFGEAVSAVVDKFRSAKTQTAALKQFMPRRSRDYSTPSSSVSREQSLPRKEPSGGGAQATRPSPTTVWGARGRSFPRQQPCKRVNLKRPNRPAASANPGRSWPSGRNEESRFIVTGRGQTAEAFLPAPNALSSLKSVTATLKGLVCRSSSLYSGWQLGDASVFPPLQLVHSPPAGRMLGDTAVSLLQGTEPVPATRLSSTSLSIIVNKDAKGSPSRWRVLLLPGLLDTPSQVGLPLHDTLLPLSHFLHEWERLPGVSLWVLRTIRSGYTLQFGRNSPRFDGVHLTVVNSASKASVLQQELSSLLQKGAIEEVPQLDVERGFFSCYFLVQKMDGGLRPILDLRRLKFSLYKGKFKMLTIKTIMSQVQEGDWFVTIDLKDAYFHIQVVQRHRRFLRFAFGGKAYQYKVLPFGLALAPRTFTKCTDAALAPLRLQGIRVLNYLDDRLILAHSRELVSRHRDIVLGHIHSLGLRMNAKKSVLLPSQRTVFLGVRLDSVQMQARLAPARIPDLTACLARFKLGHHVSVGTCRRLLGLMAAASPVLPLGLLHMRPFLWWMKELRLHPTVPATRLIRVSRSCCRPLLMWRDPVFLRSGVRMGAIHRRHMITTDASMTGWGAVFEGRPASGEWKEEFLSWHINCLKLRAVFLALKYFLPVLGGVSYHSQDGQYGGCVPHKPSSRFTAAHPWQAWRHLLLWSQDKFLSLRAVHVPGILNLADDFLSRQKLRPGEWMLNRQTVSQIWDLFGKAEVDLFASQCERFQSLTYPLNILICVLKLKVLWVWNDMRVGKWFDIKKRLFLWLILQFSFYVWYSHKRHNFNVALLNILFIIIC